MISVGATAITDVRVGTAQAKAVMFRGVQVWPPPVAWFKTFVDVTWQYPAGVGWMGGAPDLSDKNAPVKGCVVISVFIYAGSIAVEPVVFDGTKWVQTPESMRPAYTVDLQGSNTYSVMKWWNSPTAATDVNNFISGADNLDNCTVHLYCAVDGIHIVITDRDGHNPTYFVDPYPTGVTLADMPATADLI